MAAQQDKAELYRSLLSEKKEREALLQALEARYRQLKQQQESIRSAQEELREVRDSLEKNDRALPLQKREVEELQRAANETKSSLEDARLGRNRVDGAQETADDAAAFMGQKNQSAELTGRLQKIKDTSQALLQIKEERNRLIAPTARELSAVRKALIEKNEAQMRLENALITLEIIPVEAGSAEVLAGEQTGPVVLNPGVPTQIKGSPEVVVNLPGIARIRARGPAGSIDELRKNFQGRGENQEAD